MAKVNTAKTAKVTVFGNQQLNQTQFIRTAIAALWDRATIINGLASIYCQADQQTATKWAKGRLSLYERAYGPMGENDRKALAAFNGWSIK